MLRITEQQTTDGTTVLILEGRLTGPWVEVLRTSCHALPHPFALDLREVSFADAAGLALLRQLQTQDITLQNCSPFLAEQLKHVARTDHVA